MRAMDLNLKAILPLCTEKVTIGIFEKGALGLLALKTWRELTFPCS